MSKKVDPSSFKMIVGRTVHLKAMKAVHEKKIDKSKMNIYRVRSHYGVGSFSVFLDVADELGLDPIKLFEECYIKHLKKCSNDRRKNKGLT